MTNSKTIALFDEPIRGPYINSSTLPRNPQYNDPFIITGKQEKNLGYQSSPLLEVSHDNTRDGRPRDQSFRASRLFANESHDNEILPYSRGKPENNLGYQREQDRPYRPQNFQYSSPTHISTVKQENDLEYLSREIGNTLSVSLPQNPYPTHISPRKQVNNLREQSHQTTWGTENLEFSDQLEQTMNLANISQQA